VSLGPSTSFQADSDEGEDSSDEGEADEEYQDVVRLVSAEYITASYERKEIIQLNLMHCFISFLFSKWMKMMKKQWNSLCQTKVQLEGHWLILSWKKSQKNRQKYSHR